ncbi:conserved hypothetical protein [Vibrio crassostreae]|nr:conserved hypothetical protein [Vibrio crassostreae]
MGLHLGADEHHWASVLIGLSDLWGGFSNDWLLWYSRFMALLSSKKLEEATSKVLNDRPLSFNLTLYALHLKCTQVKIR